jgi:predicted secreted protein
MTRIVLHPGESHILELPGRGSAGYAWEFTVEGDSEAIVAEPQEGALPPGVAPPSTYSRTARFQVRALRAGRALVCFRLRRPWEPDPLPGEELVLDVEVRA